MNNPGYNFIHNYKKMELTLGEYYYIYGGVCKFIKVTEKGFNFLNENKNKCILKQHLYDRKYWGKPMPKNIKTITTHVFMNCRKVNRPKEQNELLP